MAVRIRQAWFHAAAVFIAAVVSLVASSGISLSGTIGSLNCNDLSKGFKDRASDAYARQLRASLRQIGRLPPGLEERAVDAWRGRMPLLLPRDKEVTFVGGYQFLRRDVEASVAAFRLVCEWNGPSRTVRLAIVEKSFKDLASAAFDAAERDVKEVAKALSAQKSDSQ